MTATEMIPAVGQTVRVRFEDLKIDCRILDVKFSYGRPLFDIEPIAGDGRQWVGLGRLEVVKRAPDWALNNGLIGEGR